ncbi:MAG TPA: ABC transporter permease [Vicinamibacterales bacterium]|jgi:putative ABC transport system permease protein|nr:ABC transporter permease [Vicinamibacterales bacterium]
MWQDLRYAFRSIRKQPAFTSLAVLTLALGIGAATTIFSVIQNVLLDPFPYKDANRVVAIRIHDATNPNPFGRTALQTDEFLDYVDQTHVFEEVIGGMPEDVLMTTPEGTEQLTGGVVTANMFQFLGVSAQLGRVLTPADARPGAPPVFVMAYKMWIKHFNGDPGVVGRVFTLNEVPVTAVGVMPARFTKLAADLWRPVALNRGDPLIKDRFFVFQAKMKPGVTLQQTAADVDVVAHRYAQSNPRNYPKAFNVIVVSWVDSIVGQFKRTLYTMSAAVGLLLVIACFNVAIMLLARSTAREREMAVRASLGANRSRLIRQLLIESVLLAGAGAGLGCLFAYVGIKGVVPLIPDGLIPREVVIRLNAPVLVFSLALAVLTVLLFGLAPAAQTARRNIVEPLKDSGKGVGSGFRGGRLRSALIVAEIALSLMLLVGAGLLMRSFVALQRVDLGLNPDNILVARLPFPRGTYKTAAEKQRFFQQVLQRIHALPGVVAATETTSLPPYGGIGTDLEIPGKTHTERWNGVFQLVSEGYARTLGLRVIRGRMLSADEVGAARKTAVVNETLVKRYFGPEDPLGRHVKLSMLEKFPDGPVPNPLFEIVGVIADAKNDGVQDPPRPEVLIPYTVTGGFERGVLVRTAGDPAPLLNSVRREIWAVDRGVALSDIGTLNEYLKRFSYAEPRFSLVLLSVFAGVGLALVGIGVYSVIAYTVSRQIHEIGIRIALGAQRADVLRLVLGMTVRLLLFGMVLGALGSYGVMRVLASQVWGVSAHDPVTVAAVVCTMTLVALAAAFFPARRAMRVDPLAALRVE